ncbi:uncharacterized protein LOC143470582 isoform X3 [Clavelina lepadiformis]|uniref:uncharacterized protein LOC143462033 isoform X4 n=1 Tax=Clavelina lepadiformis TaxID=159417 RepID=UPI004041CB72
MNMIAIQCRLEFAGALSSSCVCCRCYSASRSQLLPSCAREDAVFPAFDFSCSNERHQPIVN